MLHGEPLRIWCCHLTSTSKKWHSVGKSMPSSSVLLVRLRRFLLALLQLSSRRRHAVANPCRSRSSAGVVAAAATYGRRDETIRCLITTHDRNMLLFRQAFFLPFSPSSSPQPSSTDKYGNGLDLAISSPASGEMSCLGAKESPHWPTPPKRRNSNSRRYLGSDSSVPYSRGIRLR